jgi:LysM repeat protein
MATIERGDAMLGHRYVVKRGDSLWRIAARQLGGGAQWPRIWKYNNRPEVVRFTGRRIPNPDLIYVGQVLYVPHLPGTSRMRSDDKSGNHLPTAREAASSLPPPPTFRTSSGSQHAVSAPRGSRSVPSSLSEQSRRLQSPVAFKHSLDLRWPPMDVGTAIIETKMTGDVLLMSKGSHPVTFINGNGAVEAMNATQANHAFGRLVSDNRFIYEPAKKRVTMRSMLISQSTTPGLVATAIGVEMASDSPMPKLRADIRLPKLDGSYGVFKYIAFDVKVVLEITPKPPRAPPPDAQLKRQRAPVTSSPRSESSIAWDRVIGTGVVVTGCAIVVATIVEDFFTAGAGAADDPASFWAAGSAFASGLAMLGGAAHALPQAAPRASVMVSTSVELAH